MRLPTADLSPYAFQVTTADLVPKEVEVVRAIREAEARYGDEAALAREIDGWFRIPRLG